MKTSLQLGLLAVAFCLGLLGCEDDDTIFKVAVYTSLDTTQVYDLYVDGDLYGQVPSLTGSITCDSTERLTDCLNFTLPSGRYDLELWDEAGAVASGFKLKINSTTTKVSSGGADSGGGWVGTDGTCVVIRMD